jgi:hypothetical protein
MLRALHGFFHCSGIFAAKREICNGGGISAEKETHKQRAVGLKKIYFKRGVEFYYSLVTLKDDESRISVLLQIE